MLPVQCFGWLLSLLPILQVTPSPLAQLGICVGLCPLLWVLVLISHFVRCSCHWSSWDICVLQPLGSAGSWLLLLSHPLQQPLSPILWGASAQCSLNAESPKALLGEGRTAGKWGNQPPFPPALCVACNHSISVIILLPLGTESLLSSLDLGVTSWFWLCFLQP